MGYHVSRRSALARACSPRVLALILASTAPALAHAQAINLNLGTVVSNGESGLAADATTNNPASSAAKAPSRAPFNSTQPTSVITRNYIANSVVPTGNYDEAIKFAPSLTNVEPDGPGLQESKSIEIRGFQDGQYNILFDGIPLAGSPTDFHHQSAVYFTGHDLGSVEIDRGPGTASTIGDATFGGTLSLYSKDPDPVFGGTMYGAYGSWGTGQVGGELDTGAMPSLNGASAVIDVQHDTSNGYLTYSGDHRVNFYGKFLQPLNATTLLTFEAMHNEGFQYTPSGATPAQIAEYGPTFGNTADPTSQSYYQYQQNKYATDFEYAGLDTTLPFGVQFNNKLYTDAFYHDTYEATDPSGLTANLNSSSKTKYYLDGSLTPTTLVNAVPGKAGVQDYRAYGDVARFTAPVFPEYATVKFGMWYDHTANSYSSDAVDMSDGGETYVKTAGTSPYSYDLDDFADTFQPYAEADITPLPGLTLTPGVKYTIFSRLDDALVNKTTKQAGRTDATYYDTEPSFEARYIPVQGLSVYGQVAKGFQGPPLNVLFSTIPSDVQPTRTWNYQVGTVYQTAATDISADVYYINFNNFYQSNSVTGSNGVKTTVYTNGGGVIYKGFETEGTQNVYGPVSLYGNFTVNSAHYTQIGGTVAQTPRFTTAAGAIVQEGPYYASLIGKMIGPQNGQDATAGSPSQFGTWGYYAIKTYSNLDFAASYTTKVMGGDDLVLKLNVNNIFNDQKAVQLAGLSGDGVTPEWFTNPGRSAFISMALTFR
jgi:iron complex outermembrane receptor protein